MELQRTPQRSIQRIGAELVSVTDDLAEDRAMEFDAGQRVELYRAGRWRPGRVERVKIETLLVREVGSNTLCHVRATHVRAI